MTPRRPRILLGTVEIAGFYSGVAAALRDLGYEAHFVDFHGHPFAYASATSPLPWFIGLSRWLYRWLTAAPRDTVLQGLRAYAAERLVWVLAVFLILPWALLRFDVFCFGFLTALVGPVHRYWDLALLRKLGKRVICIFHGADSRPPYLSGPHVRTARADAARWPANLAELTIQRRHTIDMLDRLAHVVIDGPARAHFHRRRYVAFPRIGSPAPQRGQMPTARADNGAYYTRVRILHAPSARAAKGSDAIAACVRRLAEKYPSVEYVEIAGLPHQRVLEELARCDFVVDQLYSDGAMPAFATEAAMFGRPAVVCGYFHDRAWTQSLPTCYVRPDQLEDAVQRMIVDRAYREDLGRRAEQFVRKEREPHAVAGKLLRVIQGDIPEDWWIDPGACRYVYGAGQNEEELRAVLRDMLAACGQEALALDDEPELRDALIALAREPATVPRARARNGAHAH